MSLKTQWQKLAQRYNAMQLRERKLVALASVFGLGLLGYMLLIEPALRQSAVLEKTIQQQQSELNNLHTQTTALNTKLRDPDAANRSALATTSSQIGQVETDLHTFDGILVSPRNMPRMLQALLAKHRGLELVNLKTLPVTPLLSAKKPQETAQPSNMALPAINQGNGQPAPPPGGMYRHAIEITIAGSYSDIVSYAEELQRISPRPLWSAMALKVVEYPRSEVTFTLYTLSLDLPWLSV